MAALSLHEPSGSKLVLAVMWCAPWVSEEVLDRIAHEFGASQRQTAVFDFSASYSRYYEPEMGDQLSKCFIEISGVESRASLVRHKQKALDLEHRHVKNEKNERTLNIDPLLVSLENVVIATTKIASHRIYLDQGIFADLAFLRHHGKYEAMPWTYRDYVDHRPFFELVYGDLKQELRKQEGAT